MLLAAGTALSALSSGVGLYQQYQGNEQQQEGAKLLAQYESQKAQASATFSAQEADINAQSANLSAWGATASGGINKAIIGLQQQIEGQRMIAMETAARRDQLEIFRQQQRARATGLVAATAQGAQGGSGLQGAYGQISGQTGVNLLGVLQNLEIGRNIFGLNEGISNKRIEHSDLETSLAQQQAALTTQKSQIMAQYAQQQANLTTLSSGAGVTISEGRGLSAMGSSLTSAGSSIFSSFAQLDKGIPQPWGSVTPEKPTPISSATSFTQQQGGPPQYG